MPIMPTGAKPTRLARAILSLLFLVIVVVTLWVPLYNRVDPVVFGIPFFYWFQVSWIVVTAVVTVVAYRRNL
jgi:uncharacterized membrane protein